MSLDWRSLATVLTHRRCVICRVTGIQFLLDDLHRNFARSREISVPHMSPRGRAAIICLPLLEEETTSSVSPIAAGGQLGSCRTGH